MWRLRNALRIIGTVLRALGSGLRAAWGTFSRWENNYMVVGFVFFGVLATTGLVLHPWHVTPKPEPVQTAPAPFEFMYPARGNVSATCPSAVPHGRLGPGLVFTPDPGSGNMALPKDWASPNPGLRSGNIQSLDDLLQVIRTGQDAPSQAIQLTSPIQPGDRVVIGRADRDGSLWICPTRRGAKPTRVKNASGEPLVVRWAIRQIQPASPIGLSPLQDYGAVSALQALPNGSDLVFMFLTPGGQLHGAITSGGTPAVVRHTL